MNLKGLELCLFEHLKVLKDVFECVGIKSEFENEGSDFRDLVLLRYLTAKADLPLFIKIGGVEAFTDFKLALHLAADGIIIPMVESEFALIKSQNMIRDIIGNDCSGFDTYINIETRTAVENLRSILSNRSSYIVGITIGRSDLSYSYGLKGEQDSDFINVQLEAIIDVAREYGIPKITVGGGISKKTFSNKYFIDAIIPKLSCIETRNVIMEATAIYNPESLLYALNFEKQYLEYKLKKNRMFTNSDESRFETLNLRG